MKFGKLALAATSMALATTPIAAQAVASERSVAPFAGENEMGGGATIAVLFGLLALVAIVLGTDTNDEPASP